MGSELNTLNFGPEDELLFQEKLREETDLLQDAFASDNIEKDPDLHCGLELETWLLDRQFKPFPESHSLLKKTNDPHIVPEVSRFNFEINTPPFQMEGDFLGKLHSFLCRRMKFCRTQAEEIGGHTLLIGSLATLKKEMLNLNNLFPNKRYAALNERILKLRGRNEVDVDINGIEHLKAKFNSIMLECAATSLQIHRTLCVKKSKDYYNASLILSPFMAALAANAPFLFNHNLWAETRIPIFEQAVQLQGFDRKLNKNIRRVTFGCQYAQNNLLELFVDNLENYPVLLPDHKDRPPEDLSHLKLHNGTIWRWNRPIVEHQNGKFQLRIEHRVPSAGPSITDTVANLTFFLGASSYLSTHINEYMADIDFEKCRENFYSACHKGFDSEIWWKGKKKQPLKKILLEEFLSQAEKSLIDQKLLPSDVDLFLNGVVKERIESGQNGSTWQRKYFLKHGKCFQNLIGEYKNWHDNNIPVHQWKC